MKQPYVLKNEDNPDELLCKGNVMIIEDSAFITKQLTQILQGGSYRVIATAADGEEGFLAYCERYESIDLVIMDITMPKMDGLECLRRIMEFNKNARVVIFSSMGTEENVKNAILLGAKSFIIKPLVFRTVIQRIDTVIEQNQQQEYNLAG